MDDLQALREGWGQPEPPSPAAYSAARAALLERRGALTGRACWHKAGWWSGSRGLTAAAVAAAPFPAANIIQRGDRRRRRFLVMQSAVALSTGIAVAVILAVTALLPASRQAPARLMAWSVTRHADGVVYVTIRELRDPAGLQRRLRAVGIPASVTFSGRPNPSCTYITSQAWNKVFGFPGTATPSTARLHPSITVAGPTAAFSGLPALVQIHRQAIPPRVGIALNVSAKADRASLTGHPHAQTVVSVAFGLVRTGKHCT
ncbi:MAG TPA: hypothetical protein VGS19_01825 [Streptosporangiaceae bacterium]|nr:hypothetical protein [Streptosporangiaceae bacterium]